MTKIEETQREAVIEAVAEALGDAYLCGRVWSAWRAGTMSEDDFSLASEDIDFVAEIADAAIAVLHKEPRGTDAQILKEREITTSAAVGAMAYGYQGGERPPAEAAWLLPFYEAGQRDAQKDAEINMLRGLRTYASKSIAHLAVGMAEHEALKAALHAVQKSNLDCFEHFNALRADFEALKADLEYLNQDRGRTVLSIGTVWYHRTDYGKPFSRVKNLRDAIDAARGKP